MIRQVTNRGYANVNVWGGIFWNIKTPLVRINGRFTSETYICDILETHVVPFAERHQRITLVQDKAPPHSARGVFRKPTWVRFQFGKSISKLLRNCNRHEIATVMKVVDGGGRDDGVFNCIP